MNITRMKLESRYPAYMDLLEFQKSLALHLYSLAPKNEETDKRKRILLANFFNSHSSSPVLQISGFSQLSQAHFPRFAKVANRDSNELDFNHHPLERIDWRILKRPHPPFLKIQEYGTTQP